MIPWTAAACGTMSTVGLRQADFQRIGVLRVQEQRRQTQPGMGVPCLSAAGAVQPGLHGQALPGAPLLLRRWAFLPHRDTVGDTVHAIAAAPGAFVPPDRLHAGCRLHPEFIPQTSPGKTRVFRQGSGAACDLLILIHFCSLPSGIDYSGTGDVPCWRRYHSKTAQATSFGSSSSKSAPVNGELCHCRE